MLEWRCEIKKILILFKKLLLFFIFYILLGASCNKNTNENIRDKESDIELLSCIGNGVNVRSNYSINSDVITTLQLHEKVGLISKSDNLFEYMIGNIQYKKPWYKIITNDKKSGWVYGGYLYKDNFLNTWSNKPIGERCHAIIIIGWDKNDSIAYIGKGGGFTTWNCSLKLYILDLNTNKAKIIIPETYIELPIVYNYLLKHHPELRLKPIEDNMGYFKKKDFEKLDRLHEKYEIETYLYLYRYSIHDKLTELGFITADKVEVHPLPIKLPNTTIDIKFKKRYKKDNFHGMKLIKSYDLFTVCNQISTKIFSKRKLEYINNVKGIGYVQNPITKKYVVIIQSESDLPEEQTKSYQFVIIPSVVIKSKK